MKKLLLILFIAFSATISYAQFPNQVTQSNPTTLIIFNGGVTGTRSVIMPNVDTLNNIATPYAGALTRRPQDGVLYMSDGTHWFPFFGAGNPFRDTIYTALPIYVDTTSIPGRQIIRIYHDDGLISGGIVTWSGSGLIFDVTSAVYFKNYISYTSPSMQVTLDAANLSLPRTDLFVVDTFALADKITGTAATNPVVPQVNPTSQIPLTSITLNAGDTVPSNIRINVIYNEDLQYPTEWDTSRSGTIAVDYENTDNPYRGSKAAFVSTYSPNGSLIFTDGEQDTLRNGDVFKAFIYLNGAFNNFFQLQFFNGSTAVSNKGSLQAGFGLNPLDSGEYQNVSIPLNVFTFSSNYFDRVVITMQGYDTSGAKGFYIDYVQIQSGLINPDIDLTNKVDSNTISNDSAFYWIKGIAHYFGQVGGGSGGGSGLNIYNSDSTLAGDRTVQGAGHYLFIDSLSSFEADAYNGNERGMINNSGLVVELQQSNRNTLKTVDFNLTQGRYIGIATENTAIPVKIVLTSSDSLNVTSPTRVAVWDKDTLKSAPFPTAGVTINNAGAGYRAVINNGSEVRSFNRDLTLTIDSLTSGELTFKVDTSQIATTYDNSLKLNISDTTNKWVQDARSNAGGDSLIVTKSGVRSAYKYPTGGGGSGSGVNIYNSDSTLSGNRTVNGNNKNLTIDSLNSFNINTRLDTVQNTNTVLAAGYGTMLSSGSDVGLQNIYILNQNNLTRIRQTGTLTQIQFYLNVKPATTLAFTVWRLSGSTYTLVSSQDIRSLTTATSINTIILPTPVSVQVGDFTGFSYTNGSAQNIFKAVTDGSTPAPGIGKKYLTSDPGSSSTWGSATTDSLYVPVKCWVSRSPVMVAIGNSIIDGIPYNRSYIAPNFNVILPTTGFDSTIWYRVAQRFGITVQDMAYGGQTAVTIAARFAADVDSLHPRYALIEMGVNDLIVAQGGSGYASTAITAWGQVLASCAANNIRPVIVLCTPWTNGTNAQNVSMDSINTYLTSVASTYNAILVNTRPTIGQFRAGGAVGNLWDIKTQYNYDGVHLNSAGYIAVANLVELAMEGVQRQAFKVDSLGYITKGTWHADTIASIYGGTGQNSVTTGDLLVGNVNHWSKLPIGTTGQVPQVNGGTLTYVSFQPWLLSGNAGTTPGTDFIGTTDDKNLIFKRRGVISGIIDSTTTTTGNTSLGYGTLKVATGSANTAMGFKSLVANSTGAENTAVGSRALLAVSTGGNNTATGSAAGLAITGSYNAIYGQNTAPLVTGSFITALGANAMLNYTGAASNSTAVGTSALYYGSGLTNTAVGYQAMTGVSLTSTGTQNTAIGDNALAAYTTASNVFAGGHMAAKYLTTESGRIVLNTYDRTNKLGDSIYSPLYVRQSSTNDMFDQQVRLNGEVIISNPAASTRFLALSVSDTARGTAISRMTTARRTGLTSRIVNTTFNAVGTVVAGTSYTTGTYTNVPLTGGSGTNALATVVIASGGIGSGSACTITFGGYNYAVGDVLSFAAGSVGGTGSGASVTLTAAGIMPILTGTMVFDSTERELFMVDTLNTWKETSYSKYKAVTGTYTATKSDYTLDCTSGTFTLTLPTAVDITGRKYNIVNSGSGTITLGTTSSQTFTNINATPTTLTLGAVGAGAIVSYEVQSNGANWLVIGKVKNE